MKTISKLAVAVVTFAALSASALAESRVAVVDTLRLMEEAPQSKAMQSKIESVFSAREQELKSLQKSLRKLEERLARDGAVMSETESSKLEGEIRTKRRELKRTNDEFREDLNIRKNEVLSELSKLVYDATVAHAKAKKYDVVIGAQAVVYKSESVDITDEVLKRLKTQFKSGK